MVYGKALLRGLGHCTYRFPAPDWTAIFPQVFRQEYFDVLPPHRPRVDLNIELEDGAKPYHSQLYLMPKAYCAELQKWIDEILATGHIY